MYRASCRPENSVVSDVDFWGSWSVSFPKNHCCTVFAYGRTGSFKAWLAGDISNQIPSLKAYRRKIKVVSIEYSFLHFFCLPKFVNFA